MAGDTQPTSQSPEPAPAIVKQEGPLATGERLRPYALAALTLGLIGLCVLMARPFLPAITWGVALAIIAWPLHAWVLRRATDHRNWSAGVATLVVVVVIVVPGVFVARELVREAASAADQVRTDQAGTTVRDRLSQVSGMAELVAWADRNGVDIDAEVRNLVQSYFGDPVAMATGSITAIFQAVVAIFILFYLLRDRRQFLAAVYRLLPMRESEADRVVGDAAGSVFANLYAAFVTAVIDGVTLGLMFWALGLPSPVTWGLVAFIVSFLPILGVYLVWVPATIYLAMLGNWFGALALTAWGVGVGVLLTTYVYTRLAGNRMRLHPVPTLLAFLGGLAVFGASGLILGPATLAVTVAVLEVWHYRVKGEEMPASAEPEAEEKPAPVGMSVAPTPGVAH